MEREFKSVCPDKLCGTPIVVYLVDGFPLTEECRYTCVDCGRKWRIELSDEVMARKSTDNVNHPDHYTQGEVECIDAIKSALTADEFRGYLKGNIIKYFWRERTKGGIESIKKALWYTKKFLEVFGA